MNALIDSVEHARQCWNAGDLPGYLALYHDRIRLHGYAPEPMNKAGVTSFYETIHANLAADGKKAPVLTFYEVLTDGDFYTCRFTMAGVHNGPFLGVPGTARPYALPGITIMRFSGDKVIERWSCADMLGLLVQFGAMRPPG